MNSIYIAPDGNDRWSGRLARPSQAQTDGPLRTLDAARQAVRRLKNAAALPHGFTVQLRGGTYPMSQPVIFTPEDSAGVCYCNYPGETPILDGGVHITQWSACKVNGQSAWVADVSDLLKKHQRPIRSLFARGRRLERPYLPDAGRFKIQDVPDCDPLPWFHLGTDRFTTAPGDMKTFHNLTDIEALVNHFWVEERMPVAGWDESTRLLRSTHRSIFRLTAEFGKEWATYRLENVFEALTKPGQWYLDRPAGKLFYLPKKGESLRHFEAVLPVTNRLIVLQGDTRCGRFVEHLAFRGLTLAHTDWDLPGGEIVVQHRGKLPTDLPFASDSQAALSCPGVIDMHATRDVSVENCVIQCTGFYALATEPGCQRVRVVGNEMAQLGAGGVKLHGGDANADPSLISGNHRVTDNHIHDIGQVFKAAIGVLATHIHSTVISHNHIHDTHYSGISLGWVWGYAPSVMRDNTIAFNHLHHIGQGVLSDLGAIYTLGVQPGTTIHHNLIHDVTALHYGAWGIYPDEGSSHLVIHDNVIHSTKEAAFNVHYSRELIVRNNVFVSTTNPCVCFGRAEGHNSFTLTGNILVTDGGPVHAEGYASNLLSPSYISDRNFIFDQTARTPVIGRHTQRRKVGGKIRRITRNITLNAARKFGLERLSKVVDPRFTKTTHHPYGVTPNSPVAKLGFQPIDLSRVGPRPADERE